MARDQNARWSMDMDSFQDAFISYGRADSKAFAVKLWEKLSDRNLKVWKKINLTLTGI